MAIARAAVYTPFQENQIVGPQIDFDTDTIKVMLVTSSYVFSDAHEFRSSITNETSGDNYVAGGAVITGINISTVGNTTNVFGVDSLWAADAGSPFSFSAAVIYKDTGLAATDQLISYHDFGTTLSNTGQSVILSWSTNALVAYAAIDITRELTDLDDVNTSTPTNRNVLVADGVDWESRALVEADISDLGAYIENLVEDTTPQLGGTLDANTFPIDMGVNNITDTKVGNWDTAFGWGNHASAGYLSNVVEDLTPQLGANLDVNNFVINNSGISGNVALGNFVFDADQTVGVGQDNYVLTYDNATGFISLEVAAAGGLQNVVEDLTPQLGANLDVQTFGLTTSTVNGDIALTPNGTGAVSSTRPIEAPFIDYSTPVYTFGTDTTSGMWKNSYSGYATIGSTASNGFMEIGKEGLWFYNQNTPGTTGYYGAALFLNYNASSTGNDWQNNIVCPQGAGLNTIFSLPNNNSTNAGQALVATGVAHLSGGLQHEWGKVTAGNGISSEAATDGFVLTADGAGNAAWEINSGGTALQNVVEDTTPQLGGDLDVNAFNIITAALSNGDITLAPNGSGSVVIDNSPLTSAAGQTMLITSQSGNVDITPAGTGNVTLGNMEFDADQTIGAGQDDYVLTYDNISGLISLEAAAGGGVTYPLLAPDGTAAAPSYSFSGDTDSGWYYGTQGPALAKGGADLLNAYDARFKIRNPVEVGTGSETKDSVALYFGSGNANTGFYKGTSTTDINMSRGGEVRMYTAGGATVFTGQNVNIEGVHLRLDIGSKLISTGTTLQVQNETTTGHVTLSPGSAATAQVIVEGQLNLPQYTVAGAPTGSQGSMVYFTNGDAGAACVGVHDGTNWKVVSLGATISAT